MPLTFDVEDDTGIVSILASGRIEMADYLGIWEKLLGDPRIDPGARYLLDFRNHEVSRSSADVRVIAARTRSMGEFMTGGRMAVVADRELVFGLGRMFESMVDDERFQVRIFRDLEEARAWLLADPSHVP